jgi:RNA polymerase sigma factor (sigma-70 family)
MAGEYGVKGGLMSATRPGQLLRRLSPPDPDDGPLLARFAADRDPTAFAALVRRHGPVVLAVCRRVTGHPQDAEDAFQAVFLVLAKKAGGLHDPGRLGNWLYGVAVRVAGRARRAAVRRRAREVQVVDTPDPAAPDQPAPADIGPALHEELAALPAHYREPIVLCDLHGASRAEAARALGVPEGTLSSRLANGRKKLADRLTRRGVVLSAAGVPTAVADGRAGVPESLVSNTCGLVAAWAAGRAVPGAVARLATGGFPVKSALLGGVLTLSLVAGAVVAGVGADPVPPPRSAVPPPLPDPMPAVALAAEEVQEPDPPPGPKAKGAGFTTSPKLREAIDLPMRDGWRVVWSPTGDRLIVVGPREGGGVGMMAPAGGEGGPPLGGLMAGGGASELLYLVRTANATTPQPVGFVPVAEPQRFISFTPDGKQIVTVQREQKLVSGRHRVTFWSIEGGEGGGGPGGGVSGPPGGTGGPGALEGGAGPGSYGPPGGRDVLLEPRKSFDIDAGQSNDFVFAADGKSYRTLVLTQDVDAIRKIAVRRVDAGTGKTLETLFTLEGPKRIAQLTADGKRVVTLNASDNDIRMSPLAGGKGWSVVPALETVGRSPPPLHPTPLRLSHDGGRVLVAYGMSKLAMIDGTAGVAGPVLEGVDFIETSPGAAAFSAGGKLVAVPYTRIDVQVFEKKNSKGEPQTAYSRGETRLAVWDTTTGKLVRSWPGRVTAVAFHPTRPVLAVLEPNGAQTRLGLWDFSAE